jgi:hypothetical protein
MNDLYLKKGVKKMKRKMLSLIMGLIVFLSTSSIVSAGEISNFQMNKEALLSTINMSEEISNALNGITDESVPEDIMNQVDVGVQVVPKDLSRSELMGVDASDIFDISYTVKNVGNIVSENGDIGTMYSLTAVARGTQKEEYEPHTEDNVDCYITLVWIDNFGVNNELVEVWGGWWPNGRTLYDRQVWYGEMNRVGEFIEGKYSIKYPTSNTFDYSPGYTGFSFKAYSIVNSVGYPNNIICYVKTSMFS